MRFRRWTAGAAALTRDEIVKTIHFLCTDARSYVIGAKLNINGRQHV